MGNKFKEFWIELEEKGARAFVYTEPVDGLNDDAIHTVEYAALESANAEFERYKVDMAALYRDETGKCYNTISDLRHENKKLAEENARLRAALQKCVYPEVNKLLTGLQHEANHGRNCIKISREALSGEVKEG